MQRSFAHLLLAMLLGILPSVALACACCGEPNTWNSGVLKPGSYGWGLFKELKPGPGTILYTCESCRTESEFEIRTVDRDGTTFRFATEDGTIVFTGSSRLEHRQIDVSFISQSETESEKDSHILNELLLAGRVKFEGEKWRHVQPLQNATLVFRGVGNACYDRETFSRWLLRSSSTGRDLGGGGAMLQGVAQSGR